VNVRKYFIIITDYYTMVKLTFDDPYLIAAEVTNPDHQTSASTENLRYFVNKFPALIPPSATVDSIIEQFTLYQSTDLRDCENVHSHVDQWWVEIGRKHQQLQFLSQVMCGILCLPHSSAHCERIFSTVRKNKTDQRASLSEDTLDSLLVVKHQSERSKEREFTPAQIDRLKGCYYQSLNK